MARAIDKQALTPIIVGDDNAKSLVNRAEELGRDLAADGLSKSQIRNIFGEVRRIEADWQHDDADSADKNLRRLLLLMPRMAYQRKREPKTAPLMDTLTTAVDLVADAEKPSEKYMRFRHFVEFFEAILAYHTAYERKSN